MSHPSCQSPSESCHRTRRWSARLSRWLWACDCGRAFGETADGVPSSIPLRGDIDPGVPCPKCGAPMALVTGSRNGDFWSCSRYPACRRTRQQNDPLTKPREGAKK